MGEAGSMPMLEEKIAGSSYHERTTVRVNRLGCPHMRLRLRAAEPGVHLTGHFGVCLLTQNLVQLGAGPAPFRTSSSLPLQQNPQARNSQMGAGRVTNGKLGTLRPSPWELAKGFLTTTREWVELDF